jgi:putative transposase
MSGRLNRQPTRLKDYDYSQNGYYYVTICTDDRKDWFGRVEKDKMVFNEYGVIAKRLWDEIPAHFEYARLDEYAVMPDHIHGIIIIDTDVGGRHACPLQKRHCQLLPVIIGGYKSAVARRLRMIGGIDFQWQRSFYDHVIRSEATLQQAREYINNNPLSASLGI